MPTTFSPPIAMAAAQHLAERSGPHTIRSRSSDGYGVDVSGGEPTHGSSSITHGMNVRAGLFDNQQPGRTTS